MRRLMQGLHSIESDNLMSSDVIQRGWAHALSSAYILRVGRTANQCLSDYHKYEAAHDATKADCCNESVVIGVLGVANDFDNKGD